MSRWIAVAMTVGFAACDAKEAPKDTPSPQIDLKIRFDDYYSTHEIMTHGAVEWKAEVTGQESMTGPYLVSWTANGADLCKPKEVEFDQPEAGWTEMLKCIAPLEEPGDIRVVLEILDEATGRSASKSVKTFAFDSDKPTIEVTQPAQNQVFGWDDQITFELWVDDVRTPQEHLKVSIRSNDYGTIFADLNPRDDGYFINYRNYIGAGDHVISFVVVDTDWEMTEAFRTITVLTN